MQCERQYEDALMEVYPLRAPAENTVKPPLLSWDKPVTRPAPEVLSTKPRAFIPVFPGTNCEYDTAAALERAGIEPHILVIKNLSRADIAASIKESEKALNSAQMLVIPGGFSGGDEPEGSGKFINAFFRNPRLAEALSALLDERGGLILGICNGFQALVKLGLVPFGRIIDPNSESPTLTYNTIGRHQSMLARTRIASTLSPWLAGSSVGAIYTIPISHGEGRFIASENLLQNLAATGQIAAQYVGMDDKSTMDSRANPAGSAWAIEAVTSPDGRILGKMGHSERWREYCYKNVSGIHDQRRFENAARYFG
jgi:phosphoribosylformylglycinamidine synthase